LFPSLTPLRSGIPALHEYDIPGAALLDTCPNHARDTIAAELHIVKSITADGITGQRQNANGTTWEIWHDFCHALHFDPYLQHVDDPIPLLHIFAHRYRVGEIAPSGAQVHSRTVEGALRAVGQTFAALGSDDPRLQPSGKLDLQLSRQLSAYKKRDPPPTRVTPIPFPVNSQTLDLCYLAQTNEASAIADMLLLGFFFLLCPGEYAYTDNEDASPFRFCDIHIMINDRHLMHYTAPEADLAQVNFVALEFTNQKNGVRGELVAVQDIPPTAQLSPY
jgi:hypothetical protein